MDIKLIKTDTLLFIAIVLGGFGAGVLATDFGKGMIALLAGAGIVVVRAILKEKFSK